MRIRVYRYGENPDKTPPHRHVSKSTAARWCDWGTHVMLSPKAIRERYSEPFRALPGRVIPPLIVRDSPDKMPPIELPQVHFVEPQSAALREAHRMVTFRPQTTLPDSHPRERSPES